MEDNGVDVDVAPDLNNVSTVLLFHQSVILPLFQQSLYTLPSMLDRVVSDFAGYRMLWIV